MSYANEWSERRRGEIIELFRKCVYGRAPAPRRPAVGCLVSRHDGVLDGTATFKQVRVDLCGDPSGPAMTLLLVLPYSRIARAERVPCFLGFNFFGNQTIDAAPEIQPTDAWVPNNRLTRGLRPAQLRGLQSSSWPLELIIRNGYGLATAYCGDVAPDRPDGLSHGVHQWFQVGRSFPPSIDSWGTIAGWAWGLSRAMDYLVQDEDIAADQVAVIGHSRLGKAALWAGAEDQRFAMIISNNSGCGGATLFRRRLRETISILNNANPHWFCRNFHQYNDREASLPVDQHMLLALIAPRPVYIASAQLDLGADPMGEFLAAKHATPLYRLLGTSGLPADALPTAQTAVMGQIGYHMRKGHHALTAFDWAKFITFANNHFRASAV
jgi:hypothetical protein